MIPTLSMIGILAIRGISTNTHRYVPLGFRFASQVASSGMDDFGGRSEAAGRHFYDLTPAAQKARDDGQHWPSSLGCVL